MKRTRSAIVLAGALALAIPLRSGAAEEPARIVLDFEADVAGASPRAWTVSRSPGGNAYAATIERDALRPAGALVARLAPSGAMDPGAKDSWGHIAYSVDAAPYRGRKISLRAAVRARCPGENDRAYVLLRVDLPGGRRGFFENMADRPITTDAWRDYEISGEVDPEATAISIEVMATGAAEARVDDVRLEAAGRIGEGALPPRPLDARSLENLIAFARLYGLVRFFHPSDESAAADWSHIAVEGARVAEGATSDADLRARLEEIFLPLAPTLAFDSTRASDSPGGEPRERVAWRHRGVGLDAANPVYSSRRERAPASLEPLAEIRATLAAGLSCTLPLELETEDGATVPRAAAAPSPRLLERPGTLPSALDRSSRIGAVVIAWNVFRHFYPYADVTPCDWDGSLARALDAAATDASPIEFLATLRRFVAEFHDGHGTVTHPMDPATHQPKIAWDFVEGRLVVTHVDPTAGLDLRPGDVVGAVDGVPIGEAIARETALASAASPQFLRVRVARQLLHGPADVPLVLGVETEGASALRTVVAPRTVPRLGFRESRPGAVAEIRPGILYVDLDRVRDAEFGAALPRLTAAKGVVFDLRGYPRTFDFLLHLASREVDSPEWQIPVVTRPFLEEWAFHVERWKVTPRAPRIEGKVAFLTDGRAISAAETCLAIVHHGRLGDIVGSPTAGTNGNINPIALPGGYTVTWTGMKVTRHDGTLLHGVGILPTVPVTRTIRGVAAGRDEALEKAIEVVSR